MTKESKSKSLKDQNRWQLWLIIAANAIAFYLLAQSNTFETSGWKALFAQASNLLPIGLAIVVTTVANGLLNVEAKSRLVFLRWHQALPGHRAFSKHGPADPRVDMVRLKRALGNKMPEDHDQENRTWYRCYKEFETDPAVLYVHRDYLLLRDYTALSALFLIFLGPTALYFFQSSRLTWIYLAGLLVQFIIVRHAAAIYGVRFVTTVLARKAA